MNESDASAPGAPRQPDRGGSLHILMVVQPSDGGVFDHVTRLGGGLIQRGHRVTVCGPLEHGPPSAEMGAVKLPMLRDVAPAADLLASIELARVVRRVRPNVIHAHSSKAGALIRCARLGYPGTPVVYTAHGYAFAGYFESERARRAYKLAERLLAPLASRVLCVCEAEARLAKEVGGTRRIRVAHNGIEPLGPGPGLPAAERAREDGPVIGAVGLLRPGKGLESLLDAMSAVLQAHPGATLLIGGEGPDRSLLDRRIAALRLGSSVSLLGAIKSPAPLMRSVDVFVHPSWAESFPYAILEAMSLGLPIVATDVGGVGEAIADGDTGMLVAPRDPGALAIALMSMLENPDRARAIGAAARERFEASFTLSRMLDGTLAVYREVTP